MEIRPMRLAFVALAAASLLFAAAANATPVWSAPAWYQIADTIVGPFVIKGPFAGESECRETLPPNEEDADYTCEYLNERPVWDD
jgi:hypothetical protein